MKTKTWKFEKFGNPEDVMLWCEEELPVPGPAQVLVKINAIGLNHSDLSYVLGRYFPPASFPSCQGGEAVGEILALGAEAGQASPFVKDLAVGSRVALLPMLVNTTTMGVFRNIGLYDARALLPVPESYSNAEAAALWLGLITMAGALEMGGVSAAQKRQSTLLVTAGASGMGVIALKLARAWGMTSIATSRKADKVSILQALADHVVVCENSVEMVSRVKAITSGKGVDIVLDPLGAAYFKELIELSAAGGHIVSYECMTGRETSLDIMGMMMKGVSLHGYTVFRLVKNPDLLSRLIHTGMEYAESIRPLIADNLKLGSAPAALSMLGEAGHVGKIVLTP